VAGVPPAAVGVACEDVDRASRRPITDAGYGPWFLHRTGHGIGLEEHEDPYIIEGNATPLVPGHAFSVEPGIYLSGVFGARIEDIVVASSDGPIALNQASHALTVVEG
jgi:Xaa-Pro aminopeptidase